MDFKLPDIGEGIHEGEIVKWLVKEGDAVKEDQPLVEVMTDKATVEIPSPVKGKIQKIYFKEGSVVQVESVMVTIAEEGEVKAAPAVSGHSQDVPRFRGVQAPQPKEQNIHVSPDVTRSGSDAQALATPAIRKLAKDLNVDLSKVSGTGPGGRITEQDLKGSPGPASSTVRQKESVTKGEGSPRFTAQPVPKSGPEERIPLRGVRKTIAHHLQMSKHFAPHYSYVEEVDMTDLMKLRNEKKKEAEKQGIKLTYLAYIVKALISSLKEFPYLNASLDETTQEIVLKKYYHIGVAVATPDGLIVPVIKNADQKNVLDVAKEIVHLSDAVKSNKATPQDLKGSTFTVTSIGSIGGVFATPIINYPDAAIMGVNKIIEKPIVKDGKIVPRHMMYLSLTLDHRVVDGAIAAHFMNKLVSILQNPKAIL